MRQVILDAQDLAAADHVRLHFSHVAHGQTHEELLRDVRNARAQARRFGLVLFNDQARFLNLCAMYGWQFWADESLSWMSSILRDTRISDPRERLRSLVSAATANLALEDAETAGPTSYTAADFSTSEPLDDWDKDDEKGDA